MKSKIQGLYQMIKKPVIIKLFFPSLFILFSFRPGEGPGEQKLAVIQKEVTVGGLFQNVSIDGDISVILTNEPAGTITMEGNEKNLDKVKYTLKNKELIINAQKKNRSEELTIYLSAATLKSITINGDMNVSSTGIVKAGDLQIWLNGNVNLTVKTTGKISVDAYDGYEIFSKDPLTNNKSAFLFDSKSITRN